MFHSTRVLRIIHYFSRFFNQTMIRFLIMTTLIAFLGGCGNNQEKQPAEQAPAAAKPAGSHPAFDGAEAFGFLTAQTNFGPRVPNTDAHDRCLDYLRYQLGRTADTVTLQRFSYPGYDKTTLQLTNIFASINPGATTRILLLAHWDSRPRAEQDSDITRRNHAILGANDGASGVAVLLEVARVLKQQPPAIGVDILLTDGEDYGKEHDLDNYLLGAKHFAKNLPAGYHPEFGILLDMVGDRQLQISKEQYSMKYAPEIVTKVWSAARDRGITQFTDGEQGWVMDDHLPLLEAGIKTIDLIDFDYPDETNRYWHTTEDTPDKCSPESLTAVGTLLLSVIASTNP
jgi:glutaminyl-peptide cyclotransferase